MLFIGEKDSNLGNFKFRLLRKRCLKRNLRCEIVTIFAIDLTFSNFIFLTYIKYCFFSFATTSQEEERSDLMSFLTVTTNLIEGIVAVCYKNKVSRCKFSSSH